MPLFTRGANALFDAFSAPASAFALEADLIGAWNRRRAALLEAGGGGGGGVAWPEGAGGGGGGTAATAAAGGDHHGDATNDLAKALVFGVLARPLGCGPEEDEVVAERYVSFIFGERERDRYLFPVLLREKSSKNF